VRTALLAADGTVVVPERLLVLDREQQQWTFDDLPAAPIPSLLRGFSAPVQLDDGLDDEALLVLLAHDSDPFNRWEAGQRLALRQLLRATAAEAPAAVAPDAAFVDAMRAVLRHPGLDPAFKDLVLTLPDEGYIAEQLPRFDPQRIHAARETLRLALADALHADWSAAWESCRVTEGYEPTASQAGRRALANRALAMLCLHATHSGNPVWPGKALQRFKDATNMTDRLGAVSALLASHSPLAEAALERLYANFRDDPLVLDKWFALQAAQPEPLGDRAGCVFERARALARHPDFTLKNPNRARSVLFTLCARNPAAFHRADGAAYEFWADRLLELDALNPQIASRLARSLDRWSALVEPYRSAARAAIARVASNPELSDDLREVVTRTVEAE
jgi:aminopeptidase N